MSLRPDALYPDFFGLWSAGRFVLTHAPGAVYNDHAVQAYQQSLGLPDSEAFYPFPYPPWILILLAPLGALPYAAAHGLWLAATFGAYAAALTAWRWKPDAVGLLLLAPSSAICLLIGQNGFLTAAMMIGGVRLLPRRPILAGVLLASLACKPQLALLAPFLLLFGRHWRALAGAGLWLCVITLLATVAFGPGIWTAWLMKMHEHVATLSAGRSDLRDMMPTVTSATLLLGASVLVAHLAQAAGALFGLAALWRVRNRSDLAAQAVLPLAAILAAPYAFDYDLPAVGGMLLALMAARTDHDGPRPPPFSLLMAGLLAPGLLFARMGVLAAVVPAAFVGLVWALSFRPEAAIERAGDVNGGGRPGAGLAIGG